MKFSSGVLAILAALPSTFAVRFTNSAFVVRPSVPITLTWDQAQGAVNIILNNGPATALQPVLTVLSTTAGATSGSYTWTPSASLPSDTYALSIVDSTNVPNYSIQFQVYNPAVPSPTTTASAISTATAVTTTTTSGTSSASTTGSTTGSTTTSTTGSTTSASSTTGTSTITSGSSTTTTTSSKTSSTTTAATTTPANSNNAPKSGGAVLALVLGVVASFMMFN